jgi:hypothetical protein
MDALIRIEGTYAPDKHQVKSNALRWNKYAPFIRRDRVTRS